MIYLNFTVDQLNGGDDNETEVTSGKYLFLNLFISLDNSLIPIRASHVVFIKSSVCTFTVLIYVNVCTNCNC